MTHPGPQAVARTILAERRFHGSSVPRPLHGVLVWLGKELRPLGRPVRWFERHVPGGASVVWTVLALFVVAASVLLVIWIARRPGRALTERSFAASIDGLDPAGLEHLADEAERAGRPDEALRLRFQAGLLRLGHAKVLPLRPSLTSGEARRALQLREFDQLARTHDEVVFGGRVAHSEDAVAAREGWRRVLQEKRAS